MFESGVQCIEAIVDDDTRIIVAYCYFFSRLRDTISLLINIRTNPAKETVEKLNSPLIYRY